MVVRVCSFVALWLGIVAVGSAVDLRLERRDFEEAIAIGASRIDTIRTRFHAGYRLPVGIAPVDYIDVITPFRRVVMAAEARARFGDRLFGLRDAQQSIADAPDEILLYVELTFHPLNTFVGVPAYEVVLTAGRTELPPARIERIPRFGPRVEGFPSPVPQPGVTILPGGGPLTGGTIAAHFPGSQLDPRGVYEAVVKDRQTVLARARIDLGRLR
jgi:hypothetical protein